MKKTLNRQSGSAGRAASLRVIADRLAVADALYRTSQGSRGLSNTTPNGRAGYLGKGGDTQRLWRLDWDSGELAPRPPESARFFVRGGRPE